MAFAVPNLDPLLQISRAASFTRRLTLRTCVYVLPRRHPSGVAKQVAALDHLAAGRLIFGVGAGGEFPGEFDLCGAPLRERGALLAEGLEVLRKLCTCKPVSHAGRHSCFGTAQVLPPARQAGGPLIWVGGRSDAVPSDRAPVVPASRAWRGRSVGGGHPLAARGTVSPGGWRKFPVITGTMSPEVEAATQVLLGDAEDESSPFHVRCDDCGALERLFVESDAVRLPCLASVGSPIRSGGLQAIRLARPLTCCSSRLRPRLGSLPSGGSRHR